MKPELAPTEIFVLHVVSSMDGGDLKEIFQRVKQEKDWKIKTVGTLLFRLSEKGYITKTKIDRRIIYKPKLSTFQIVESVLNKLFGSTLTQNPGPLVAYLLNVQEKRLNKKEKDLLQSLLDHSDDVGS